jgi:hypothetical protein
MSFSLRFDVSMMNIGSEQRVQAIEIAGGFNQEE